ncbi:MAG: T9SS type A sorting domain-containing protein [Ignavibacteriales bacterium]|nr:T9SS type A sorting domain-containing protein [Ignavibacteriales bacterium]
MPYFKKNKYRWLKNICTSGRVSTVLVFSNSDSLCTKSTTNTYVKTYLNLFTKPAPVFKAFNLLDHTQGYPDSVTIGSISYSGAGYLLQDLAEKSNGSFFAPRPFNWTAIPYLLKPKAFPSVDSMKVAIQVFGLNDTLLSLQKVSPKLYQENAPNFFLGSLSSGQSISITADTWLEGNQPVRSKSFVFPVRQDTSRMINPLRSMLGNEQLLDSVNKTSVNFVNLINIAKKYHLLSDYTGMQILQGNDTLIAIVDPFDETQLAPVEKKNVIYDSLSLAVYPNPFNSMASIIVKLNNLSSFNVFVYDMLGRSVKTIVTIDQFKGKMKAFWDGKDASGKPVATGIYFLMLKGSEVATGKRFLLTQKIIYLK